MKSDLLKNYRQRLKRITGIAVKVIVLLHLVLGILILFSLLYLKNNNPDFTSLMLYRKYFCGQEISPVKFIPFKDIPDDIKKMVIATEDYKFYDHPGIDIEAIKRAYIINRKVGYRMYGGSTITQQLSRTLYLIPKKLLIRKYIEVFIALEMELVLTKERILELYLNYCEWGNGIFGLVQGANHYYKKNISELTIDETTRLITILANPVDYTPYTFMDTKFLSNRYYIIKFRYYTFLKFHDL